MSKYAGATFLMIKPGAFYRGIVGEIVSHVEQSVLEIERAAVIYPSERRVRRHYGENIAEEYGPEVRDALTDYLSGNPVMKIEATGESPVASGRKLIGTSFDPSNCSPTSIRGRYSTYDESTAAEEGIAIPNLVHAADSVSSARRELRLWFDSDDVLP